MWLLSWPQRIPAEHPRLCSALHMHFLMKPLQHPRKLSTVYTWICFLCSDTTKLRHINILKICLYHTLFFLPCHKTNCHKHQFSSITQLCPTLCNPVDCSTPGFPVPSPTPRACSDSCPSSWWCYPTISSSVVPFSFCLQSFPVSGSFPMSQLFTLCGQSTGASASASVLPMNIQGWCLI